MIPTPKWSPTLKWSSNCPQKDPHFSSCLPRNDTQGIWAAIKHGTVYCFFCSLLTCGNDVILFIFICFILTFEVLNKRKHVIRSLPCSSWPLTPFLWSNVGKRIFFSFSAVLCLRSITLGNDDKPTGANWGVSKNARVSFSLPET